MVVVALMAEEKVGGEAQWANGNGFELKEEEAEREDDGDGELKGNGGGGGLAFMTGPSMRD